MRWMLAALVLVAVAGCGDDSAIDAAPVGHFVVSWSMTRGPDPTTCDDVGAAHADMTATWDGRTVWSDFRACDLLQWSSNDLRLGFYRVSMNLLDANNQPIADIQGQWVELTPDALEVPVSFVFVF